MRNVKFFAYMASILALALTVVGVAPSISSATYEIKDAVISDTEYYFAVFHVDFDQDMYLLENFPCPCGSCSTSNYPTVNETGYDITSLKLNAWEEGELIGSGSVEYFKIDLIDDLSCHNVFVEVELLHGFIAVYGATNRIPRTDDYDWYRPTSGRRYLPLCNSHPAFGMGTLYFAVRSNQRLNVYNRYKIRVTSQSSGSCPPSRTMPTITLEYPSGFQWLQDSVPITNQADPGDLNHYGYLVETQCTRFAVSVHKNSTVGDVDLFVSARGPSIGYDQELDLRHDWVSILDGEDAVSFYYCSETVPFTLWVAVTSYDLPTGYNIVATTRDETFMYTPISTLALNSPGNELSRHFRLECANPEQPDVVEQFFCDFPGFERCVSEDINCCFPMYPTAATQTPNPLWPWNAAINQLQPLAAFSWAEQDYNITLMPNRISIALMIYIQHEVQHFRYVQTEDVSNCKLSWLGRVTNSDGEAILEDTTFSQKELHCTENIDHLVHNTRELIEEMGSLSDLEEISKAHYKLIFEYLSEDWYACRDYVLSLGRSAQVNTYTSDVRACFEFAGTAAYDEDPCCNIALQSEMCCPVQEISIYANVLAAPDETIVGEQCSSPICTMRMLNNLASLQKRVYDKDNGCTATLVREADPHSVNFLSVFIRDCQVKIYGEALQGIKCTANRDCYSNICNVTLGLCSQGIEETLSCLAENIDPVIGRFVFNNWQIVANATKERMIEEFRSRFMLSDQCIGPTSIRYRDHYQFSREETTCVDDCLLNGLETYCLDTSCAVDPTCDFFQLGLCHRNYYFTAADPSNCLTEKTCNWLDCTGLTDAECETNCNTFTNDHFCGDCRGGNYPSCKEVTDRLTVGECNLGICDIAGVDPDQCANTKACTVSCDGGSCADQPACEASGECSDRTMFAEYIALTNSTLGVCLLHLSINGDGIATCDEGTHLTSIGCADLSIFDETSCTDAELRWWPFATTQVECESFAICQEAFEDNRFNTWKTQDECTNACQAVSSNAFTWTAGQWRTGTVQPLVWMPRLYTSVNSLGDSFDFVSLRSEVRKAIASKVAYAFTTESLCLYDSLVKLVGYATCDCIGYASTEDCGADLEVTAIIGSLAACPYIESSLNAPPAHLTVFQNTISYDSLCRPVHLDRLSAALFQLKTTTTLSSEIYSQKLFNSYSVVKNDKEATVGQIVSDGVRIGIDDTSAIANPFELCIDIDLDIGVYSAYTAYGFAELNEETGEIYAMEGEAVLNDDQLCARVMAGTYFAVARMPDGAWQAAEPFDEQQAQMKWVGVAFYFLGAAFGIFQLIVIGYHRERLHATWNRKLLFTCFTVTFLLLRGIYFTFPPALLADEFVIQYLLFELPTFMFFSLYTIILFLWNQVLIKQSVMAKGRSRVLVKKAFFAYLIANGVMYGVFVFFVLLYRFWEGTSVACVTDTDTTTAQDRFYITLAYRIFIAVVCFSVSLAFMVQGIKFIMIFRKYKMVNASGKKARVRVLITIIAVLCTGLFIGRTIVFLYAAVTGNQVVVVIFVLFEAIPSYALLYYLRPFNSKEFFGVSTDSSTGTRGSSRPSGVSVRSYKEPASSIHPATTDVTDDIEENYPESESEEESDSSSKASENKPEESSNTPHSSEEPKEAEQQANVDV